MRVAVPGNKGKVSFRACCVNVRVKFFAPCICFVSRRLKTRDFFLNIQFPAVTGLHLRSVKVVCSREICGHNAVVYAADVRCLSFQRTNYIVADNNKISRCFIYICRAAVTEVDIIK